MLDAETHLEKINLVSKQVEQTTKLLTAQLAKALPAPEAKSDYYDSNKSDYFEPGDAKRSTSTPLTKSQNQTFPHPSNEPKQLMSSTTQSTESSSDEKNNSRKDTSSNVVNLEQLNQTASAASTEIKAKSQTIPKQSQLPASKMKQKSPTANPSTLSEPRPEEDVSEIKSPSANNSGQPKKAIIFTSEKFVTPTGSAVWGESWADIEDNDGCEQNISAAVATTQSNDKVAIKSPVHVTSVSLDYSKQTTAPTNESKRSTSNPKFKPGIQQTNLSKVVKASAQLRERGNPVLSKQQVGKNNSSSNSTSTSTSQPTSTRNLPKLVRS